MAPFARKAGLFVLLVSLFPATKSAAQPPAIPAGWSDGYVYANGIRVHYYRAAPAPGKPVMVMVHGVTDNGLTWATLTEKFQGSYDIYMLDARGHGLTDPFTAADDGNTLVKDVVAVVQAMKFEKPILVGHSLGAATVMRVGAEYPEVARAIVMLDPGLGRMGPPRVPPAAAGAAAPGAGRATPAAPPASATAASAASAGQPGAPARLSVSMAGAPEVLVAQNNYRFEALVATCRQNTPRWALLDCQYWALSKQQYHGAYTADAWQALSGPMRTGDALTKITVPALILKADASPEVRKANEEAARVMGRGRLVHIDGAGHNLHHDQLARTVEVLKEFLSTL